MKILVFSTQHMPTGGIESHLREFCLHLVSSGAEIDLVITNSAMLPETEAFYRHICRHVYLGKLKRSFSRIFWLLVTAARLRIRHYDALYTNGQGESVLVFSILMSHYKRWVHHHHTSGDLNDQSGWGERYQLALRKADNIIACSQTNAKAMSYALNRTVDVIPCFSRAVEPNRSIQKQTGKVRLGYYGRLIPEKGIDLICHLSEDSDLQEIEFHLWGEGDTYPPSSFNKYTNVSYHGSFIGQEELANVLGSLDALLLLSTHSEGLPISLLEAMSVGLPWLATAQGGIPDIALDPNSTRLLPISLDYTQVKTAVKSLAADLKAGLVSDKRQIDLYIQNFSSIVLVTRWKKMMLGLKN